MTFSRSELGKSSTMKLGGFLSGTGVHRASWRLGAADVAACDSFLAYRDYALALEAAMFDAIFLNDYLGLGSLDQALLRTSAESIRWDPFTLLPAIATVTKHLGLIGTASTTFGDPYMLARRIACVDHISGGRAGWNIVTSIQGSENFTANGLMSHGDRYERAEEFVNVVWKLWNSWEDDAFPRNKATGQWLRPEKMHLINHRGKHFEVQGPLLTSRSTQGAPVLAQAGASEVGRQFAAKRAEILFSAAQTFEEAREYYLDMHQRAMNFGRAPDELLVMPGIALVIAKSIDEAQEKASQLHALNDESAGLRELSEYVGLNVDLSTLALEDQVPLPPEGQTTEKHQSRQSLVANLVRRELPTVGELYKKLAFGEGHRVIVGTPNCIVDELEHWFTCGAADGFNVMFPNLPDGLFDFVQMITPELQKRNLIRTQYNGRSLRENLGLRRPPHPQLTGATRGVS